MSRVQTIPKTGPQKNAGGGETLLDVWGRGIRLVDEVHVHFLDCSRNF